MGSVEMEQIENLGMGSVEMEQTDKVLNKLFSVHSHVIAENKACACVQLYQMSILSLCSKLIPSRQCMLLTEDRHSLKMLRHLPVLILQSNPGFCIDGGEVGYVDRSGVSKSNLGNPLFFIVMILKGRF